MLCPVASLICFCCSSVSSDRQFVFSHVTASSLFVRTWNLARRLLGCRFMVSRRHTLAGRQISEHIHDRVAAFLDKDIEKLRAACNQDA
jgi:hypothetical protein